MTTVAGTPTTRAAHATACAWLPADTRDQAARAPRLVERQHDVERPARLERAGLLEAFALEVEAHAGPLAESARGEHGRPVEVRRGAGGGFANGVERDAPPPHGLHCATSVNCALTSRNPLPLTLTT